VPAGSAATTVSYSFQYGTSTAYDHTTPTATATATSAGVAVSAPLSGLAAYTTYHYRLIASDCAAASCQAASPDQTFTTGSTLAPVENVTVGAASIGGHVRVKLAGHRHFTTLGAGELIPLGATFDARHGTLLIVSSIGDGEVASGHFASGIFTVTQPTGATETVLKLVTSFAPCRRAGTLVRGPIAAAASAAPKPKAHTNSHKVVNQVFGSAHGQFQTRGHYATAADEGTAWRTSDRCDGTQIGVTKGMVTVTDLVHHRTFALTAGHRYLAKKP
jgi:hypothetical protein